MLIPYLELNTCIGSLYVGWVSKEASNNKSLFAGLTENHVDFLEEAFTSLEDLEVYMREYHYHYLVSGDKIRVIDVVRYLYKFN